MRITEPLKNFKSEIIFNDMEEVDPSYDWNRVVYLMHCSRAIDQIEVNKLYPEKAIQTQFSAKGHELTQILLAMQLGLPGDAATVYYRSRPFLLASGLSLEDAFAATLTRSGGVNDGRDVGVVFNFPNRKGLSVLPGQGGVGAQYTPAVGWAQSLVFYRNHLKHSDYKKSIAVALGGDASTATNGFWSALNIATTQRLPFLFFIEDNGYGISVSSDMQTPNGNIAENLSAFGNLRVVEVDIARPNLAAAAIRKMVSLVREGHGPGLIRLKVPRLCGHSIQDSQAYKNAEQMVSEHLEDPLHKLKDYLTPRCLSPEQWDRLAVAAQADVSEALERALERPQPNLDDVQKYLYYEGFNDNDDQSYSAPTLLRPTETVEAPKRINMVTGIRMTLAHELSVNPRMVVFGEDVGAKGGVHTATLGLQDKFGAHRVFDTSLSEEGIIGRAVGMAYAGLKPVAEIQFRKYAEPAMEQLHDCGTVRWRTANRFSAPIVVRIPVGYGKSADLWHAESKEATWIRAVGWRVAFPSNAEDAVGLLRTALRSKDPVIFCEHRAMLDAAWARRNYPGDDHLTPFGKARLLAQGQEMTIITWGAMVERCSQAVAAFGEDVDLLDLRTLAPWDKNAVFESVRKTGRCLIVHEDNLTCGFGAEISAVVTEHLFSALRAPVMRVAFPDLPCPHNKALFQSLIPNQGTILEKMMALKEYENV
ncbi:alpha-ketoacid dehydrogenase subunit alpha/beta [Methylobacter sp.]|uniref:alpha-ketoacid dehydrogenase subunit alpha/beta n=1 Tax=Methylobacter sp. TaxID=2051955 RepID=UPI003DA4A6EC